MGRIRCRGIERDADAWRTGEGCRSGRTRGRGDDQFAGRIAFSEDVQDDATITDCAAHGIQLCALVRVLSRRASYVTAKHCCAEKGVNPKIQRKIFVYIRGTKRASYPSDPPAELCRNLPLNFGIYIVLFTPFHLNQNDLLS